ncbi:MAG: WG repeat-containing protein [Muribaculaceae bacterium]|nr:WG repeat-containing protein [Muribaculaceae bacterium]
MKSKLFITAIVVLAIAIMLPSCSKTSETDVEYIAVKLSESKDKWSIIDLKTGEVIARDEFKSRPSVIVDDIFYVKNDKGEYEYYNINDLNTQIGSSYEQGTYFQNERAIVKKKGGKLMVINTKGETVKTLDNNIIAAKPFKNGFAAIVNEDGKGGFINTDGDVVIKPTFDIAANFSEDGYVVVGKRGEDNITYSVINAKGEKIFSFNSDKYSDVLTGFVGGSMAVVKDDKIVYLDSEGKQKLKVGEAKGHKEDYGIYEGLTIFANEEGNFGAKNAEGEVVIRAKFEELKPNRDGSFLAKKDGKYHITNDQGEQISADEYKDIVRINADRFIVKEGNSYSIIDKNGKEIGTETFADYSYAFDDSPALNEAQTVHFSTDDEDGSGLSDVAQGILEDFASLFSNAIENDESGHYTLVGSIAGVAATMNIFIEDGSISGSYYYNKYGPGNQLALTGETSDGYLYMYEFNEYGVNTGTFSGIIEGNLFSGMFTNEISGRTSNFNFAAQ